MSEATAAGITKVHITDAFGVTIPGGGSAVSLADGADVTQGALADAVWDGIAASATVVSILKKIATSGAAAGLTDAQLRASAVPVTNSSILAGGAAVTIGTQPVTMIGARTAGATATALQAMSDNADAIAVSGVGNTLRIAALGYQYNGTTWDRLRGDATNGLKVQGPLTDTQLRASAVPVSLASTTITGSVAVTGPLTDTQLRATAVPVSLTSTTITGSVAVTGPLTDTQLRATAVPVSLTSTTITGSVAVTGPLTDTQLRASAVPVSGTFFQATQPVSAAALPLPSGASTEATLALLQVAGGTAIGALKSQLASAVAATSAPSYTDGTINPLSQTLAGALRIGGTVTATPPTLTKGTQGATGYSVQDLRDAGRNARIFQLDAYTAGPLVEAVATVVQWYGNAAVAGTTQPAVVPAGKTLRLTGYKIMYQSLATAGFGVVRIRANTAGLGVLGSPLVASFEAGSAAAVAGVVNTEAGDFPEGLELPAGTGLSFSIAGYSATGALQLAGGIRFIVHGYEY